LDLSGLSDENIILSLLNTLLEKQTGLQYKEVTSAQVQGPKGGDFLDAAI
jgi:hypothetical protein